MPTPSSLRILSVAPDTLDADEYHCEGDAERSRSLRIGLLEQGCNIVAVLPADAWLPDRVAQIGPDMIIVGAQSNARDTLEPVLNSALTRFQQEKGLKRELADTRAEFSDRKTFDRANGQPITKQGKSETEAYASLRKQAMDKG